MKHPYRRSLGRVVAVAGMLVLGATVAVPSPAGAARRSWTVTRRDAGSPTSASARVPATSWILESLAATGDDGLLAVGYSTEPTTQPVAMKASGSSFTPVPVPQIAGGGELTTAAGIPGTVGAWAGGAVCGASACPGGLILRWTGSGWSQSPLPKAAGTTWIDGVSASSASDAWAVGNVCPTFGFQCTPWLLHWNGTLWSAVRAPGAVDALGPYVYSVADISPTDAWVVGGDENGPLALHWNGAGWVNTPVPGAEGGALNHVAPIPGTSEVWAVGASSGNQVALRWNGSRWVEQPFPLLQHAFPIGYAVNAAAATSPANAWAVGDGPTERGTQQTVVLHWGGLGWSQVPSPDPGPVVGLLDVAATAPSAAWAVGGQYSPAQPQYATGVVLRWTGTSWVSVKVPAPGVSPAPTPRAGRLHSV